MSTKEGITTNTVTIEVTPSELHNIIHGLELLQAKAYQLQQDVKPFDNNDMGKYFREVMKQTHEQSLHYRNVIRNKI